MKKPKVRELGEALKAVFSPRFTSKFPSDKVRPAESFRGAPSYQEDECIGCSGCFNVCPANAITKEDILEGGEGIRRLRLDLDNCIFCGQCEKFCTVGGGIELTKEYDLAYTGENRPQDSIEKELLICDACDEVVGTKDHVLWLYRKLGPKAYSNPTLFLTYLENLGRARREELKEKPGHRSDRVRILCPNCRREITLIEEGKEI